MQAPMLYFDLETAAPPGFDAKNPEQAVPVQIALGVYDPKTDGAEPLPGFPTLVNPGFEIDEQSTEIHGITPAMVAHAPRVREAVGEAAHALSAVVQKGMPVAGMNLTYDFTVLDRRLRHADLPTLGQRTGAGPGTLYDPRMMVLDACVLERGADKFRSGRRKLADLCARYGITLTDAHDGDADGAAAARLVATLGDVAEACAQQHPDAPPRFTAPTIHVPGHHTRPALELAITTPHRFAALADMMPEALQDVQAGWHDEFVTFVTSGNPAPGETAWPVRPYTPAPTEPAPTEPA